MTDFKELQDLPVGRRGYSVAQTQELLGGLSRAYLYELMRKGALEYVQTGRRRLIPSNAIDKFLTPNTNDLTSAAQK